MVVTSPLSTGFARDAEGLISVSATDQFPFALLYKVRESGVLCSIKELYNNS